MGRFVVLDFSTVVGASGQTSVIAEKLAIRKQSVREVHPFS